MTDQVPVRDLIRDSRRAAGLTQKRLADAAGVSIGVVRDIEQGRSTHLHEESIRRLSVALGLNRRQSVELRKAARGRVGATIATGSPGPAKGLRLTVLGPTAARRDGVAVALGPPMQRAVLGLLALHPGALLHRTAIIDALWADDPPGTAVTMVQTYVSRLRRVLGATREPDGLLVSVGSGYRLQIGAEQLDLAMFATLARHAQEAQAAGEYATACRTYAEALGIWRGEPLADVEVLRGHPRVARVSQQRAEAVIGYAEVASAMNRLPQALPHLWDLTGREPLNEQAHAHLMLALAGTGHQAAALRIYQDVRRRLDDQLGVLPGAELDDAHARVLRRDIPTVAPATASGHGAADAKPVVPQQLPATTPHFAGRAGELAILTGLLGRAEHAAGTAVTCVIGGMAGVGKTALAVHWAHQVAHRFPDGQLYVNLHGFDPSGTPRTPAAAVRGFLDALDVPAGRIPADLDAQAALYRSLIAGRAVLVVLDNARDAEQVRPLLPGGPGCMAVVTSRNPLTGLMASPGAHAIQLDVLAAPESADLLTSWLGARRTAAENDAAGALIELSAGLPLAVSIVAARAAGRPAVRLAALAAEIRRAGNPLDALDTQDTATDPRAVFSWSYRLLRPPAARLFRLMGLHAGPDITVAAAASLAGIPVGRARQLLATLAEAHLVAESSPGRYSFHDLLRAYAIDRAEAQEQPADRAGAVRRVLAWYAHTAVAAAKVINPHRRHVSLDVPGSSWAPLSFDGYDHALDWLEAERANLVAAVACASRWGDHETAWKLPIALWDLFNLRSYWTDWIASVETGLDSARRLHDRVAEAWLLNHLGIACASSGHPDKAIDCLRQTVAIRRTTGDRHGEAAALANLGRSYLEADRLAEATACLQEAVSAFRAAGRPSELGRCLINMSTARRRQGRLTDAMINARLALHTIRTVGDQREESGALTQLALANLGLARSEEAVTQSARAVELARHCGDRLAEAEALTVLGQAHEDRGHPMRADRYRHEAYLILSDLGDPRTAELLDLLDPMAGRPHVA